METKDQEYDVIIIGAGWYGLVAARTYLRLRPEAKVLVTDSDNTVGGVWSSDRLYPNLVAQVKLGLFNYTDTPMPSHGKTQKNLVTGNMIHDYLQKYAEDHDLLRRVRFNSHVERAERYNGGWRLHLRNSKDVLDTKKLMVATGVTSIPSLPSFEAEDISIPILHSRDLGSSSDKLQDPHVQHVVVLGAAKSAYDAVYLLLSMGKKVTWIIRPDGAGPLAILPTEVFGLFNVIAVASTRLMTFLSPSIFNTTGPGYGFFQKTVIGRWCTSKFWDTLTYLSNRHAGYFKGDHISALLPEIEEKSIFYANSGLGVVTLPDYWSTLHAGDLSVVRDHLTKIKGHDLILRSGTSIKADTAVMCTGWGDHFAMFDPATKLELGLPAYNMETEATDISKEMLWKKWDAEAMKSVDAKLPFLAKTPDLKNPKVVSHGVPKRWRLYRRVVPLDLAMKSDRSLAILGQIHTVQTPLVSEMQSFWAILYLLGELDLPDYDTMAKEVAEWNVWTAKRYLSQGQKHPYSLYDFLPYVDTLCKDLGINSRRKGSFYGEIFSPYKPEDFNGFIDEYLEKQGKAKPAALKANGLH
ncbi:putative dimethylaniline monooxygenase [Mytilinidion resinicola]|uniref:Dimethylaniline monooxygenase n=1 Tax=Mytilinidion resinicola TaxID=574789 RepID=A0A6A6YR92_9PEZI|nr:putative dimethylaniline monooxygenase [Mytilinidion resinicola]KAF2811310.1 putative dimethylaniline monooxygenase [Mytilinidion resinicola]